MSPGANEPVLLDVAATDGGMGAATWVDVDGENGNGEWREDEGDVVLGVVEEE